MHIHSNTPRIRGLLPVCLMSFIEIEVPTRNKVVINKRLAIRTMLLEMFSGIR